MKIIANRPVEFEPITLVIESVEELQVLHRALYRDDPDNENEHLYETNIRLYEQMGELMDERSITRRIG